MNKLERFLNKLDAKNTSKRVLLLVGKTIRIRDWSVYRNQLGKCVEYVPGRYEGTAWVDAYYIVEVADTHIKLMPGEIKKPWFGSGFLHFLFKPWRRR
jgi:hypothetical protein